MGTAYIRLDINVKFRAFGITFGTVKDSITFPLTGEVGMLVALLAPKLQTTYNQHGVLITVTLVPAPAVVASDQLSGNPG